jgi:N utilization substance protein A
MHANLNLADNEHSEDELGSNSAGQSGDIQQISDIAGADSESVEELVEEGNAFEAAAVEGVENAEDPDVSEVTTRQVPEDDVPPEYLNDDGHVG